MKRLLLISNSTSHGERYLQHCESDVREHLQDVSRVLFVPYALKDLDGYAATARTHLTQMGWQVDSIHESADPVAAVRNAESIFIGGGNTFRLLDRLQREGLIQPIRERVGEGMPYMGASAGSNMACPTIMTTNDMPIIQPASFEALDLVDFQLNPHYLDPDPDSSHMGETRETRIREYLEENDRVVVGLREACSLFVRDESVQLRGRYPARIFRRAAEPVEVEVGNLLDPYLKRA